MPPSPARCSLSRPTPCCRRPCLPPRATAPCCRRRARRAAAAAGDPPPAADPQPVRWAPTLAAFAPAALGGALFGYDIGATSGALASLKSAAAGVPWAGPGALTALGSGAIVSSSLAGALAGSAAAFAGGEALGRRGELLLAGGLYTAASIAEAAAPSLPGLLGARFVYGLAIGAAMHAAPAYIAETAPPSVRGLLVSAKEACIVGGILGGYALAFALASSAGATDGGGAAAASPLASLPAWRVLYGAAAPVGLTLLAAAVAAPESPRWLALAGRGPEAVRAAVRACRGAGAGGGAAAAAHLAAADAEAAAISASAAASAAEEAAADAPAIPTSALALATDPRYGRAVRLGLSLMLLQQVTGQPSVLYYATDIFASAGFGGASAAGVAAGLGAFKLAATGVAVGAVDRAGRRPLLIGGVAAMTAALVALAAAQAAAGGAAAPPASPGPAQWAAVAALLAYVAAYQVSFGPISWLIVGEALPLAVRGRAAALATLTNFASNFAVSLALPSVQAALGPAGTYAAFAAVAAGATVIIAATVPETKGKSLEEIEAMMVGGGGGTGGGGG